MVNALRSLDHTRHKQRRIARENTYGLAALRRTRDNIDELLTKLGQTTRQPHYPLPSSSPDGARPVTARHRRPQ